MTCDKEAINGTNLKKLAPKKIKLAKVVAKEKKILARTLLAKGCALSTGYPLRSKPAQEKCG